MAVESNNKLENFSLLGDDVLGLIVNKIKETKDRKSFSEVCREWLRVEGLHRSSIRLLQSNYLHQVLPRFPNLVKFEAKYIPIKDFDLEFLGKTCPRLEFINLRDIWYSTNETDFVGSGLVAVAKGCPNLAKVDLGSRRFITASFHVLFYLASNLTHLDLACTEGVSDQVVEAIAHSHSIIELNLGSKELITDRALVYLANGNCSKSLKTLILAWVVKLTDVGVIHLRKMHCLEHLSLTTYIRSGHLSDNSGVAISAITTLKKLSLKGQHKLSDRTIIALAQSCPNLKILDLQDCGGRVTGDGICAFSGHQCLETIGLPSKNVSGWDLDNLVLGCPSLKSIVMPQFQMWLLKKEMEESTRKLVDHRPLNLNLSHV